MTGRLGQRPPAGDAEPVQREEQPHSGDWRSLLASTLASKGRIVLVAGPGLAGMEPEQQLVAVPPEAGEDEAWRTLAPLVEASLRAASEPPEELRLAAEAIRASRIAAAIYTGVDGALSRLAAERRDAVIEVYGSVTVARCPRCGTRIRLAEAPSRAPRCPRCGAAMQPDAVPPGGEPIRRRLRDAVYEATTADLLLACCLDQCTLATTLTLAATRFTRLLLLGDDPVLRPAASAQAPAREALRLLAEEPTVQQ